MRYKLLTLLAILSFTTLSAQELAIKTNLLYDATKTVNAGVELGLGKRTTLDVSGNYNAWNTNNETNEKMRHMLVQPELRYYFCEKMNGHFFGVNAHLLQYNVSGEHDIINLFQMASTFNGVDAMMKKSRYQGDGYGAGVVYGYAWDISKRLNLEFAIGAGYTYFDYDRYGASKCAPLLESSNKDCWGLTKLGISLVYIIK